MSWKRELQRKEEGKANGASQPLPEELGGEGGKGEEESCGKRDRGSEMCEMGRPTNRFQKMIQDMERKYATARPLEKAAKRRRQKRLKQSGSGGEKQGGGGNHVGAVGGEKADEISGGAEREGGESGVGARMEVEDGPEAVGECHCEGEGEDEVSDSNESWYDTNDDFIDDSELIDEMGVEALGEQGEEGEPQLKASGFFISRGALQTEEGESPGTQQGTGGGSKHLPKAASERAVQKPPAPSGRGGRSSCSAWRALCAIACMLGEQGGDPEESGPEFIGFPDMGSKFHLLVGQSMEALKRKKMSVKQACSPLESEGGGVVRGSELI